MLTLGENRTETISTHAPRTGSDGYIEWLRTQADISTHAPRTGSDTMAQVRAHYRC